MVSSHDAWLELLRWHDETLRSYFAAHDGEEVGTTGDGFFVEFDSPDAAVACAVAVQRRLADHRTQPGLASRRTCGSGCMHPEPRKWREASAAREFTRPRGLQL
jgi:class 3 adenylate cyclase